MKIGIQGAGIAGTTLAYWLYYFGHEPVLIEQSPELRKGGYLIDFWGIGYDIAEKMGLLPELKKRGYPIEKIHWKDNAGKTQSSFDVDIFRGLANNRYLSIERPELAAAIYELIRDKVEIVLGDSISVIKETYNNIQVSFEKSSPQNFDLLIGADGGPTPTCRSWSLVLPDCLKKAWDYVLPQWNCRGIVPGMKNRLLVALNSDD